MLGGGDSVSGLGRVTLSSHKAVFFQRSKYFLDITSSNSPNTPYERKDRLSLFFKTAKWRWYKGKRIASIYSESIIKSRHTVP